MNDTSGPPIPSTRERIDALRREHSTKVYKVPLMNIIGELEQRLAASASLTNHILMYAPAFQQQVVDMARLTAAACDLSRPFPLPDKETGTP